MKCPNCKTEMEISNGVATCPKCGARYRVKESDEERQVAKPQTVQAYETTVPEKPKTNDLADIKRRLAAADEVQDLKIRIAEMEEKQAKLERDLAKAKRASQSSGAVGIGKSGFTATVFELFSEKLLMMWVSLVTLGIAYPWLKCHYESFKASKTYIKGRRLVFVGKGGELAKKYFLWAFLSVITFGIFSIFVSDKMHKWVIEHTHYDGNESAESSYDGKVGAIFGFKILGFLAGVFTFGLAKTFVICKREKYFATHSLINGAPIYFDGTGFGLLKKQALWGALTVATFGVFALWTDQQRRQWICSNLSNDYADDVSADSETPEEERARIEEEKHRKEERAQQKALKKQQRKEIRKLPAWKASTALFVIGAILLVPLIPFMVFSFVQSPYIPEVKIFVTCLILCAAAIIAFMAGSIACSKKIKRKALAIAAIVIIVISAGAMGGGFYGVSEITKYSNVDPYYYIMQEDGTYAISLRYNEKSGIEKDDDMYWAKRDKQESFGGNIVIPSNYQGVPVTAIADYAFRGCSGLTSITIGNGVTSIGESAFSGCTGLTSVTIPDSLTSIGESAFSGCTGLTSVTIPDGVTSIGESAFSGCTGLTIISGSATNVGTVAKQAKPTSFTVNITSGTSIGDYAFSNCTGLTSVTIPASVTSIGNFAFSKCTELTSVTIGNSVTSIGYEAFYGCYRLVEVYNKSALSITADSSSNGYVAYYAKNVYTNEGGSKLTTDENGYVIYTDGYEKILVSYRGTNIELILPSYITKIYKYAFYGCSSLTSITIGNGVTSIGNAAFYDCGSLTSITIGNSVTSIGGGAFVDCTGLTSITIPNSVTSIGDYAFSGCTGLTTVNWNATECTSVSSFAIFEGCSNLATVNIGDNVTTIPSSAFRNCTGLTSVTIPDSVTSIGYQAFQGCTGLTNITIGNSVTSIGNYAFVGCIGLTSIIVGEGNTKYHSAGNCLIETATKTLILGCKTSVIPAEGRVTSIGDYAFRDCTGLTSITIPDSVTSIGYTAFYNCSGLTSVTIPDSVTSIGDFAFYDCTGLTSITFNGTIKQWKAIRKGGNWNYNTGNYVVHCTDGDISKANS